MKAYVFDGTPEEVADAIRHMQGDKATPVAITTGQTADHENRENDEDEDEEEYRPMPTEIGRKMLTRIPLAPLQKKAVLSIYNAGDEGIMGPELAKALDYSSAQFRGLMGAFGRRISHTEGFEDDMYFFDQEWIDNEGYRYKLPETSRKAVEAELM